MIDNKKGLKQNISHEEGTELSWTSEHAGFSPMGGVWFVMGPPIPNRLRPSQASVCQRLGPQNLNGTWAPIRSLRLGCCCWKCGLKDSRKRERDQPLDCWNSCVQAPMWGVGPPWSLFRRHATRGLVRWGPTRFLSETDGCNCFDFEFLAEKIYPILL